MSWIFDAQLQPSTAQIHALLIGVGDYPHLLGGSKFETAPARHSFGLPQLSSPPSSATALANWLPSLTNRRCPIGTIELLLSPSSYTDANGNIRTVDLPTMANMQSAFSKWSKRADANSNNIAIFYFCGHGLEKEVSILLPCDFGDPQQTNVSVNMVDFNLTYLCNLFECSAATQLYLIDACRETPAELLALRTSPTALISTTKLRKPPRDAPVFKAANSGLKAHGEAGKPSFFSEALLACLQKLGARGQNGGRWEVTTNSLGQAMKIYMQRRKVEGVPPLVCDVGSGTSNFDTVLHTFEGRALVMSSIDCDPNEALPLAQLSIGNGGDAPMTRPAPAPEPWEVEIAAGQYHVQAVFAAAPYQNKMCDQLMQPPFTPCTLEVGR